MAKPRTIKMLTLSAGPAGVRHPGSIHEVSHAEGAALVGAGHATWVDEPVNESPKESPKAPATETATVAAPERAVGAGQSPRTKTTAAPPSPAKSE